MNISRKIIDLIDSQKKDNQNLTFLCIGTDRVTGDSLGPIVGSNLEKYVKKNNIKNIKVIGNLENNLSNTNINKIENNNGIRIVIDSAISNTYDIGDIIIDKSPIKIRQALNSSKDINSDIAIKCIVGKNFEDSSENFLMLQNIKIGIVLNLAEKLSTTLYEVIENYNL